MNKIEIRYANETITLPIDDEYQLDIVLKKFENDKNLIYSFSLSVDVNGIGYKARELFSKIYDSVDKSIRIKQFQEIRLKRIIDWIDDVRIPKTKFCQYFNIPEEQYDRFKSGSYDYSMEQLELLELISNKYKLIVLDHEKGSKLDSIK